MSLQARHARLRDATLEWQDKDASERERLVADVLGFIDELATSLVNATAEGDYIWATSKATYWQSFLRNFGGKAPFVRLPPPKSPLRPMSARAEACAAQLPFVLAAKEAMPAADISNAVAAIVDEPNIMMAERTYAACLESLAAAATKLVPLDLLPIATGYVQTLRRVGVETLVFDDGALEEDTDLPEAAYGILFIERPGTAEERQIHISPERIPGFWAALRTTLVSETCADPLGIWSSRLLAWDALLGRIAGETAE
jgi:hypothetical protein